MNIELGALEKVELRKKWESESRDFTPWLAQENNLALLGDAIGLELEFEDKEVAVGPYFADILAKDTATGKYVIIENQLDKTDHSHLGQSIMYGAVLDASAVIWIASDFTDEHRKSLDWLNNHTNDGLDFYGVQIELWKIGESLPAPRLNVVSRPAKVIGPSTIVDQELSPTRKLQLEFWTKVRNQLQELNAVPSVQTARPQYWYDVAIGRSYFVISCIANTYENRIGVRLYLSHHVADKALFLLGNEKAQIEAEIGTALLWNPFPEKQDKIIAAYTEADLANREKWPEYIEWMIDMIVKFRNAFRERVKRLDLGRAVVSEDEKEA